MVSFQPAAIFVFNLIMQFDIITLFPKIFDSYLNETILKRAQGKGLVSIKVHNLRDYSADKHKTVDDKPFGGGPGMILKIEPIYRCLQKLTGQDLLKRKKLKKKKELIIAFDPAGKTFDQKTAQKFSKARRIILLAGRYEGFDHRVYKIVDQRISIGDYVLSGGELPALVIAEAVSRLIPGVIGHSAETLREETFSFDDQDYIEYPQYTRPEIFEPFRGARWKVPKVLLSGHHQKIRKWRQSRLKKK